MNTEINHFVLPSAPVKTLWFEFLFTEGLLESHLATPNCDPSAIELIIQFLANAQATSPKNPVFPTNGADNLGLPKPSENADDLKNQSELDNEKKAFHLKLLALKVMSFLKWDLEVIESKLPLTMQHTLVEELQRSCERSPCETFSVITYHRWLIRSLMKSSIPIRNFKSASMTIPVLQSIDPCIIPYEILNGLTMRLHKESEMSVEQLFEIAVKGEIAVKSPKMSVPSISSFKVRPTKINEDGSKNYYDWTSCHEISSLSLLDEVRFELGKYFFTRDLDFNKASSLFQMISKKSNLPLLEGYVSASKEMAQSSENIEETEEAEMFDPRTSFQNCLQDILDEKPVDFSSIERTLSQEEIVSEIKKFHKKCKNSSEKKLVSDFTSYLSCKVPSTRDHLTSVSSYSHVDDSPLSPMMQEIDGLGLGVVNMHSNEQLIIESTDPEVILDLSSKVTKEYAALNSTFFVPRLLVSCTQSIASPSLANKCLLVLAKAYELKRCKLFVESRTLFLSVLEEFQALVPAFSELLPYEILHNDLEFNLTTNDVDERRLNDLLVKCNNVLRNERTVSELSPDLLELSCRYLLENSKCHPSLRDFVTSANPIIRFSSLLYLTTVLPNAMACKDFWDTITMALLNDTRGSKKFRSTTPNNGLNVQSLTSLITKINSSQYVAIVASALVQMYNLVRDKTNDLSLIVTPVPVHWPTSIPTTTIMPDLNVILIVLTSLVQEASSRQPVDSTWTRVIAELALTQGEYNKAMKYFLETLSMSTSYFTNFTNKAEEEETITKMISSCNKLNCHTSSAILRQMTTQPNYAQAFKSLGERFCFDSSDHLYECIWDVNLLEYLVFLHTKRCDLERKLKAVQLIGQLELNANNSKEILSEAANVKKGKFFRILSKKYL